MGNSLTHSSLRKNINRYTAQSIRENVHVETAFLTTILYQKRSQSVNIPATTSSYRSKMSLSMRCQTKERHKTESLVQRRLQGRAEAL